ncbi:MAG: metal-sensing transcriptional repressor [Erysipelotrichaceae bacterium]
MSEKCCCEKKTIRSEAEKKLLINRLNRIAGQIKGIAAMVEKDCYCPDILIQCSAVNSAINSFNRELLANHIKGCVTRDIVNGEQEVVDELIETIQKVMR